MLVYIKRFQFSYFNRSIPWYRSPHAKAELSDVIIIIAENMQVVHFAPMDTQLTIHYLLIVKLSQSLFTIASCSAHLEVIKMLLIYLVYFFYTP